ncbi:dolichyl-diphosphooligosaccharide--protein glycosyltransferase subunit 1 [Dispira parvispora]|uniref:Dolichyl-diphosphooligosaccharide--protein glycosyltransferase subunit 1 n=1 Tax=Dispira parvispora TaxID=1520584 RepID=A0A9W8E6D7_9FUNG|nr:dolichyl-diphosphooligosaccharide--protein glycosyltransferase subunit 1 [Dispira parvispora]
MRFSDRSSDRSIRGMTYWYALNWALVLVFTFVTLVQGELQLAQVAGGLTVTNARRTLDLTGSDVREQVELHLENTGSTPVEHYYWLTPASGSQHVGLVHASVAGSGEPLLLVKQSERLVDPQDSLLYDLYALQLPSLLPTGGQLDLSILAVRTNATDPLPRAVGQFEKHYLVYQANVYLDSPYPVQKQSTKVLLPSSSVQSFSQSPSPTKKSGKTITYGPYSSVVGLARAPLRVHYYQETPILTLPSVHRQVRLSHWGGFLTVDDHAVVKHTGAELKGNYQETLRLSAETETGFIINNFHMEIPRLAYDVYFRDEVGNLSTTTLHHGEKAQRLIFQSRYPLCGGWIYNWNHGYHQPLSDVLRYDPETQRYNLQQTLPVLMKGVPEEQVELDVILPEGAYDVQVRTAMEIDHVDYSTYYSYMDSVGRVLVRFTHHHVVSEYGAYPIIVSYRMDSLSLFLKPVVLGLALLAAFLLASAMSRVNFKLPAPPSSTVPSKKPSTDESNEVSSPVKRNTAAGDLSKRRSKKK